MEHICIQQHICYSREGKQPKCEEREAAQIILSVNKLKTNNVKQSIRHSRLLGLANFGIRNRDNLTVSYFRAH
ncbi:hypothetical protein J6590_058539 [Homalodisca vitripennis]|nr:hypothetical protein J6590_058539 [Homalodisca vitripennis]